MKKGKLIVCGNHSGNLSDTPPRTIEAIKASKYIFCDYLDMLETNTLEPHQIDKNEKIIVETGEANQIEIAKQVINVLASGNNAVLITDTGLPGFADQGPFVIKQAYDNNFEVQIISGPSIIPLAVTAAGIPASGNMVIGIDFFKYDKEKAKELIDQVKVFDAITVVICHPYQVDEILDILFLVLEEDRLVSLCTDISLETQKVLRGKLSDFKNKKLSTQYGHTAIVFEGSEKHFNF
jgi:16S rRNA (cytidine1402-2'-O)-methyltransferase